MRAVRRPQAAARGIRLSAHAPYFAVLTVEEPDKSRMCLSALEHTMKLGQDLGSSPGDRGPRRAPEGTTCPGR